jgi:hypothetical protein
MSPEAKYACPVFNIFIVMRRWMFKTSSYKKLVKPLKRLEARLLTSLEVSSFLLAQGSKP